MAGARSRTPVLSWGMRQAIARLGVAGIFIAFVLWVGSPAGVAWAAALGRGTVDFIAVLVLFGLCALAWLFEWAGNAKSAAEVKS